jgi:hypothetical protein
MFSPFESGVWFTAFLTFTVGVIAMKYLQFGIQKTFISNKRVKESRTVSLNWINLLSPILQRAIPLRRIPDRWTFIISFGCWIIFGFLLSSCYSNILTGVLTFPPSEQPIDSLEDLLQGNTPWTISALINEEMGNGNTTTAETAEGLVLSKAEHEGIHSADDVDSNWFI